MRSAGLLMLLVAALAGTTSPTVAGGADHHVVVICVDGLPAYLFDDSQASMPHIRRLAAAGVRASGMTVSNPSVTWPNHTSLISGVRPEKHGVLFNGVLMRTGPGLPVKVDPKREKQELVHVATLDETLHEKGLRTAAINWPCTRNANSFDDNFPDVPDAVAHSTPRLLEDLRSSGIATDEQLKGFGKLSPMERDRIWTEAACHLIRTRKPHFLLLHPLNVDAIHHRYGPQTPAGYTAVAYADRLVGDVVRAIDDAGVTRTTTVFVVSDHGFVPIPKTLQPNVLLRQNGLLTVENQQVTAARAHAIPEGGIAMLYLTVPEQREADRRKVIELFTGKEGISEVLAPDAFGKYGLPQPQDYPQMADLILVAKDGYGFNATATGDELVVKSEGTLGTHGFLHSVPKMNATFIASGAGIRRGEVIGQVENIDLAPTVARLLGVPFPADGKPVAAALLSGSSQ